MTNSSPDQQNRSRSPRAIVMRALAGRPAIVTPRPVRRILIIRPDHLGDLLFATPALTRLREAFPRAHLTGMVGPWGRASWQHNRALDTLQTVDFPGIVTRARLPWQPYTLLMRTAREVRAGNYDLAIVLRFDYWWGALLAARAGIPLIWGYDLSVMGPFLTNKAPYTPGRHEVEQNMELVESIIAGIGDGSVPVSQGERGKLKPRPVDRASGQPPLDFPIEDADRQWAAKYVAPRPVVIHPGTNFSLKLWTLDGWARVVEWLVNSGQSVLFTGSSAEGELIETIRLHMAPELRIRTQNLAGETTFMQLAALLKAARLVVGVDSGPLHLAEAIGTATVRMYGPSDEQVWGPWGPQHMHTVIRASGTAPSSFLDPTRIELEGGAEMKAIEPDRVIVAVDAALMRNA